VISFGFIFLCFYCFTMFVYLLLPLGIIKNGDKLKMLNASLFYKSQK